MSVLASSLMQQAAASPVALVGQARSVAWTAPVRGGDAVMRGADAATRGGDAATRGGDPDTQSWGRVRAVLR
ncbi:MAG: hypothetical protein H7267_08315, partial [Sandarakinorhabdus sp.]|nr:hypothetical protein [Sandarakinorhabdus sp.]